MRSCRGTFSILWGWFLERRQGLRRRIVSVLGNDDWPRASHYSDRHGKRRWRYQSKGFSAQLGTEYASDEFIRRYEAPEKRAPQGIGASRSRAGSMSALIASWYRSPKFLGLGESTKTTYRRTVEPLRLTHSDKRVSQ